MIDRKIDRTIDRSIDRKIDRYKDRKMMAYIRQHTKNISTLCCYLICFDLIATFNWVYFKTLVEMADRQTDRPTA